VVPRDDPELAVIFKRTYHFEHGAPPTPAHEQLPLVEEGEPHDELVPGLPPSARTLPETIGLREGTDLIVQGSARPGRPVTEMRVAVRVGPWEHQAVVYGRRFARWERGRIRFTAPEPFEEMPLRYELAYGGRDAPFEKAFLEEVQRNAASGFRRALPALQALFGANHPLFYPRNRFGKGYVLEERADSIEGRELPNLERPDDLLTPDRLVVGHPLAWLTQPIPVGFDHLDHLSFPRTAMLGLPPMVADPAQAPPSSGQAPAEPTPPDPTRVFREAPEVRRGLVPADLCRGSIATATPETLPDLVHPQGVRSASLGLQLPTLDGHETIGLYGMDPDRPSFALPLPAERPLFVLDEVFHREARVGGTLVQVKIEMAERRLTVIWVARAPLSRPLTLPELQKLEPAVSLRMERIGP
jgi:hypothetical protein